MALVEPDLFDGQRDKVKIAIKRLQQFEPKEGYYLAFSGGKDSQTVYELAKLAKVKFDAHFHLTTVDPPEVLKFVKKNYPDVGFDKPKYSMWALILKKQMPPTRIARYCCEYLKEGRENKTAGGAGRLVLTGVRWEESTKRKSRKMVEFCLKNKSKKFMNAIIDWTEKDVWEFIKKRMKIPYCVLYDEGFKRIGCIGCPLAGPKGMKMEFKRYPKFYQRYYDTFKKMLELRRAAGKDLENARNWSTVDTLMEWWINGKGSQGDPDQTVMFE